MYYEIAIASPSNRNIIIREEELKSYTEHCQKNSFELYRSVYSFDESIKDHFKSYKSVKSFNGNLYLDDLILDIDIKSDTDAYVLQRAKDFYNKLRNNFELTEEEIRIYYSGRGYHFEIPNYFYFETSPNLHKEVKATISEVFPEVDSSIYMRTGLIRVNNTINRKVNRYKILLTKEELLTLDDNEIKLLAKNYREISIQPFQKRSNINFSNLKVKTQIERIETNNKEESTRIVTCMQHLYSRGSTVGRRHIEGLRLVSAWRVQGLTQIAAITLLKNWASTLSESEINKIVRDVYEKGYRYGCQDEVMMSFCDSKCIYYKNKNYITDVLNPNNIQDLMYKKVMTMPSLNSINLKDIFNLPYDYKIYEGEMVIFWGDTKIGKSTLVQNIVTSISLKTLYLSLENRVFLDARRLLQIKLNKSKDEVYATIREDRNIFSKTLPHLFMMEQNINVQDLYKIIVDSDVKVIVIDTLDQLKVPKVTDYTTKTEILASELREFTNDTKVILLGVHHISKHSSIDSMGNNKSMHIHSGKGSSAIEQKADKIISIEGARDIPIRIIKSLGARDESPFEKAARFDTNTFKLIAVENKLL